jgi:hypothetical protein
MKYYLSLSAIALLATSVTASADVILTPLNSNAPETINSVGTGTDVGADGYQFYEAQPTANPGNYSNPTLLPSYVASITPEGNYGQTGNSTGTLTISGTPYVVGDTFGANQSDMVTLALTGTVPTFNLGILVDNGNGHAGANVNTLTVYSGAPGAMGTTTLGSAMFNTTSNGDEEVNHFYFMNVAGASTGDYLVVSATTDYAGGSPFLLVGGVTIDTATTPEPSTVALILAGVGALGLVARLRRRNA